MRTLRQQMEASYLALVFLLKHAGVRESFTHFAFNHYREKGLDVREASQACVSVNEDLEEVERTLRLLLSEAMGRTLSRYLPGLFGGKL